MGCGWAPQACAGTRDRRRARILPVGAENQLPRGIRKRAPLDRLNRSRAVRPPSIYPRMRARAPLRAAAPPTHPRVPAASSVAHRRPGAAPPIRAATQCRQRVARYCLRPRTGVGALSPALPWRSRQAAFRACARAVRGVGTRRRARAGWLPPPHAPEESYSLLAGDPPLPTCAPAAPRRRRVTGPPPPHNGLRAHQPFSQPASRVDSAPPHPRTRRETPSSIARRRLAGRGGRAGVLRGEQGQLARSAAEIAGNAKRGTRAGC